MKLYLEIAICLGYLGGEMRRTCVTICYQFYDRVVAGWTKPLIYNKRRDRDTNEG